MGDMTRDMTRDMTEYIALSKGTYIEYAGSAPTDLSQTTFNGWAGWVALSAT